MKPKFSFSIALAVILSLLCTPTGTSATLSNPSSPHSDAAVSASRVADLAAAARVEPRAFAAMDASDIQMASSLRALRLAAPTQSASLASLDAQLHALRTELGQIAARLQTGRALVGDDDRRAQIVVDIAAAESDRRNRLSILREAAHGHLSAEQTSFLAAWVVDADSIGDPLDEIAIQRHLARGGTLMLSSQQRTSARQRILARASSLAVVWKLVIDEEP